MANITKVQIGSTSYEIGTSITFNLTTSWSGTGPYTQTVTGLTDAVTSSAVGVFGLASTATATQYNAAVAAKLLLTAQSTGSVTITAYGDKPTVAIPCVINIA